MFRRSPEVRQVSPASGQKLIQDGALLVDVREMPEIRELAFDVADQMVIPLSQFEARFAELPRDRELVIACKAGGRSYNAACYLKSQGFEHVANMDGGIMGWASSGLPVKRGG